MIGAVKVLGVKIFYRCSWTLRHQATKCSKQDLSSKVETIPYAVSVISFMAFLGNTEYDKLIKNLSSEDSERRSRDREHRSVSQGQRRRKERCVTRWLLVKDN